MSQANPELPGDQPGLADEIDGPDPVDESDGELQRAPPVHPTPERALLEPRLELLDHGRGIANVPGGAVGTPEHHQLVMAVWLPDNLGVSGYRGVPIVDQRREPQWRQPSALVITVPVDGIAKVGIRQSEKAQP